MFTCFNKALHIAGLYFFDAWQLTVFAELRDLITFKKLWYLHKPKHPNLILETFMTNPNLKIEDLLISTYSALAHVYQHKLNVSSWA